VRRLHARTVAGLAGVALLGPVFVLTSRDRTPAAGPPSGAEPHPVPAVRAVVDALRTHRLVVLGESHDLQEAGRLYDRLLRSDRFSVAVDEVVVEFANARYQSIADRYVRGGDVPAWRLRRVWQDTTQVGAWDAPMYRRFFAVARRANADRPPADRIRILLGDPPIDWSRVGNKDDVRAFLLRRENFMAHLIEQDVLAEGRRAVLIAGLAHVERAPDRPTHPDVTQLVDRRYPGETWVVGVHLGFPVRAWEDRLTGWPIPSIVSLEATWIGRLPKGAGLAQDALDAMLYVGAPDALHVSIPLPSVYVKGDYWQTLKARWSLALGGSFSAKKLFGPNDGAGYPELFSQAQIASVVAVPDCMRANGVESFPDPQFQYDSVGFYGPPVEQALQDPNFPDASAACGLPSE
jgi:hypothetical protein